MRLPWVNKHRLNRNLVEQRFRVIAQGNLESLPGVSKGESPLEPGLRIKMQKAKVEEEGP